MEKTLRLYLQNDDIFEATAQIKAIANQELAFDQTCFYPGGGGQPPDEGTVTLGNGETISIVSVYVAQDGIIWHKTADTISPDLVGQQVTLNINKERRHILTRYHTVLHVLNTIALTEYNAWITGVQIGTDYSRIDFKFEEFTPSLIGELETKVNMVLQENHSLKAYYITEAEFNQRSDLLRTLTVKPPVENGKVRVMEIEGFDAQACGGTHVHTTSEVGTFSIFKTDNKGKNNKRLYVKLE